METQTCHLQRSRGLSRGMMFMLSGLIVIAVAGCEQPLKPGETYHKLTIAWPIFDVEKSEGIENGVHWAKEKGDACFWLASWEKLRKFDNQDVQVYAKERSTVLPFYNAQKEDTPEYHKTWGSVLLYPYNSYAAKNVSGMTQPSSATQPSK